MNPIAFGTRDRRLFGIYTPAGGRRMRRGAVICAPFGHEYLRTHRACRLLSERLAARGMDVLRFDYYGTGDSAGNGEEVSLTGCARDASLAVDEVNAMADLEAVTVIGLRLGGVAAAWAARDMEAVDRLVLWDPVADGRGYLHELLATPRRNAPAEELRYANGFPITEALRHELAALSPEALVVPRVRTLLIVSRESPETRALQEPRPGHQAPEVVLLPGPPVWAEHADLGVGAVPVKILEHIGVWSG